MTYEIYNFGKPLVIITTYLVYLTYEERGVEKKIFKEIMHFRYLTYMTTP